MSECEKRLDRGTFGSFVSTDLILNVESVLH